MKSFYKIFTIVTLLLTLSFSVLRILSVHALMSEPDALLSDKADSPETVTTPELPDDESPVVDTPLRIKAFNPGYTIDGIQNVGEFIELINVSDETPLSLTGFILRYTNSSGKISNIVEFPEGSQMTGETLLLRLSSAPEADDADYQYSKTLAMEAGPLELVHFDQVIDTVCWKGKDCLAKFSKDDPTSIVQDLSTGEFSHQVDYYPEYDPDHKSYLPPPATESTDFTDSSTPQCYGLNFNELLSYYDADKSEQFIEFFNPTDESIHLDGCQIRYKHKVYPLSGNVGPNEYYTRDTSDFTLTKNPTTSNTIELLDTTDEVIDTLEYAHGQKKGTAYALFGYDESGKGQWFTTYVPTPGAENTYQEYRNCPAGKIINESTGNCVNASTLKSTVTECPAGKYRNPVTGRCKNLEDNTTTPCKEGYERNPETGRCRKIKNNSAADYALVPETGGEQVNFVAFLAVGLIALVAIIYIIFQFRHEIIHIFVKLKKRIK